MLFIAGSDISVGRLSQKEKQHEKRDYQDSAIDGDVACNRLGFSTGRYFACAPLLSAAVSTEVMLVCGREGLFYRTRLFGVGGWFKLATHIACGRLTRYSC
jgi:hypothetical protein